MKNRLFLILAVVTLVIGGGFFTYYYYVKLRNADRWTLVPSSAILVYESTDIVKVWNQLQPKDPWRNLLQVPYFEKVKNDFESLDSIGGNSGQLDKIFHGNPLLISMHITGDDALDFMYYIELKDETSRSLGSELIDVFKKKSGLKYQHRTYRNTDIHEIINLDSNTSFTYVFHKNYFIGSFTSYLVEDAIRNISGENLQTFKNQNEVLFEFSKLDNDDGNLYLNSQRLPELFGVFSEKAGSNNFDKFSSNAFLDITVTNNTLLLNGFSEEGNSGNSTFLGTLIGQESSPINTKQFIPNRTAILFNISLSDPVLWQKNLLSYWSLSYPNQIDNWDQLNKKFKFETNTFFEWLGQEISVATLESVDEEILEKILILNALDINEALNQFNQLSESIFEGGQDTLYHEQYSGHEIREVAISSFPEMLLGPKFQGFDQSFYTSINSYLILANNVQTLKNLINDIEYENVWSKSLQQNGFMENILQEANISFIVNTKSVWNMFLERLGPKWSKIANEHRDKWQQFENLAVQFSSNNENFFTSISVDFVENGPTDNQPQNYILAQNTFIDQPISTQPYVVRNHTNGQREVLIQDVDNNLYLLDNGGKILWKDSIYNPILGEITQIDYYNNDKLQYFFITENAIHVIDRLGNYVEGFPIPRTDGLSFDKTSVVDYDKSKRYRFLISDVEGNIYMFDKFGKNLEGWQPRRMKGKLAIPPFHVRVRGKDCIIAIQEDGIVSMLNRRGEMYPGFPFDLKDKIFNPLFVNIGTGFEQSNLTTVTNSGQLVKFNFNGAVVERKQLYRPSINTVFSLAIDALGRSFVIGRQEENRVSVLNHRGEEIFEKDYVAAGPIILQYYNFGRGQQVFALTDETQEFTYLYDGDGGLINYQPIESGFKIGLIYYESQQRFKVYKNYENTYSNLEYKR